MKTFLVTITTGPRTRWAFDDQTLEQQLTAALGRTMRSLTDGDIPSVTVTRAKPYNICQACRERVSVQNELCAECLTAARAAHADAYAPKPCHCEICTHQTGIPQPVRG